MAGYQQNYMNGPGQYSGYQQGCPDCEQDGSMCPQCNYPLQPIGNGYAECPFCRRSFYFRNQYGSGSEYGPTHMGGGMGTEAVAPFSQNAPYDPEKGIMAFYDLLLEPDPSAAAVHLVAAVYDEFGDVMGTPMSTPIAYCSSLPGRSQNTYTRWCILDVRQAIYFVPPVKDYMILVELRTLPYNSAESYTQGWCKIPLFNEQHRPIVGHWRIRFRLPPIQPHLQQDDMNTLPEYGACELLYRIANYPDIPRHTMQKISTMNTAIYRYAKVTTEQDSRMALWNARLRKARYQREEEEEEIQELVPPKEKDFEGKDFRPLEI